jgi:NAD-dependent DNA ligase
MPTIEFPAELYNFIPGKYVLTTRPFHCVDYEAIGSSTKYYSFTTGDYHIILENNMIGLGGRDQWNSKNSLKILVAESGIASIHASDAKTHFIAVEPSTKLAGLSFCMTGEHAHLSRAVVDKIIIMHGGEVKTAVTKGLTYLLQGSAINKGGSKLAKAQKLGVQVIHEAELYKLIA